MMILTVYFPACSPLASALANELPEEYQFRFLRATCLANLKGSVGTVGLILAKESVMRISTPFGCPNVHWVTNVKKIFTRKWETRSSVQHAGRRSRTSRRCTPVTVTKGRYIRMSFAGTSVQRWTDTRTTIGVRRNS